MPLSDIRSDTCIVRNTAARHGRTRSVAPGTTAMRELHYGRIILDGGERLTVEPGEFETGLICLKGAATIAAGGQTFAVTPYDTLYVPRDMTFEVTAGAPGCDFAELAAKVAHAVPAAVRAVCRRAEGSRACTSAPAAPRRSATLNILIGKNVEAGRILAGVTFSAPGQLDVVAAARARRDARRGVSLHRHAGARVRRAAGLLECGRAGARDDRARRRRRAHAAGLSSQRGGARRLDQLSVDDGGAPRARGSAVRRRQRASRFCPGRVGARSRPRETRR